MPDSGNVPNHLLPGATSGNKKGASMPYMKVKSGNTICVHKQNADKSAGDKLHCYTGADADARADSYMRALYANVNQELDDSMEEFSGVKGGFLVTESDGTTHLPTTVDGKPDHGLMGAAWAALHGGYRGQKYQGPDKDKAIAKLKAMYEREKMTPPSESSMFNFDFLFTELGDPKPFEGMAAGKFTDMSGQTVEIKSSDLPKIVEHTKASIESTRTESGEIVGLPIDPDGHNHAGGAGWIVDVSLDSSGTKIKFIPKWTEVGLKLIKDNIRRFFSVSLDLANKVILGGSLTNWPATRTKEGKILLRPIELSIAMFAIDESLSEKLQSIRNAFYTQFQSSPGSVPMMTSSSPSIYLDKIFDSYVICQEGDNLFKVPYTVNADGKYDFASHNKWVKVKIAYQEIANMTEPIVPNPDVSKGETQMSESTTPVTPTNTPAPAATKTDVNDPRTVNPKLYELLQTPEVIQELGRQAEAKAKEMVDAEVSKQRIVEFATTLVGGTKDHPYGLPVRAEEVVALLVSLPPQQAQAVEMMLTKAMKAINFAEMGVNGEYNAHPRLPEEFRPMLKTWMDSGKELSAFFSANPEVGSEEDFNLSEFKPKEK
jgi:hypothetical protein